MGDGSYAALIEEAEKYLGYPYVFGGRSPSTSFDCSGFICWVYKYAGVYDFGGGTAEGIYNQCIPITEEHAQPGDLIFFKYTYNPGDGRTITHVDIYTGPGEMLHCGGANVYYASYRTNYWQNHYPTFGCRKELRKKAARKGTGRQLALFITIMGAALNNDNL